MRTPFDGVCEVHPRSPVSGIAVIERRDKAFDYARQREWINGILSLRTIKQVLMLVGTLPE